MNEPWLDTLSEDWNSLPRSSPAASPLGATPAGSAGPTRARQVRSKIPRYSVANHSSSPNRGQRKPKQSSERARRVLSEHSDSDINKSSLRTHNAQQQKRRNSWSSSTASDDSILPRGSVVQRPQSSSPARGDYQHGTPEWKRRIMKTKGGAKQQDLFSPMGLEEVFQNPIPDVNDDSFQSLSHLRFGQDVENMPSSPPPWPKLQRPSKLPIRAHSSRNFRDSLGVVEERDETEYDDEHDTGNLPDERTSGPGHQIEESMAQEAPPQEAVEAINLPTISNSSDAVTQQPEPESQPPAGHIQDRKVSTITTASSSSGFSPVYISKHNNLDGQVNYAPIDPSDFEVAENLRRQGLRNSKRNELDGVESEPGQDLEPPDMSSGPALAEMSPFVNVQRGGYSDEDSFKRRPLSPSASSSLAPADSISQVQARRSTPPTADTHGFVNDSYENLEAGTLDSRKPFISAPNFDIAEPKQTSKVIEALDRSLALFQQNLPAHGNDVAATTRTLSLDTIHEHLADGAASSQANFTLIGAGAERDSNATASVETVLHWQEDVAESDTLADEEGDLARPADDDLADRHSELQCSDPRDRQGPLSHAGQQSEVAEHSNRSTNALKDIQRTMEAAVGQKRRDALYDSQQNSPDLEAIAKRQILRPRNPTPVSLQRHLRRHSYSSESAASERSRLDIAQEHIQSPLDPIDGEEEMMALASKVATLRMQTMNESSTNVRKGSVSTQDYVDEAMKIMELIRSNRRPQSVLVDLQESVLENEVNTREVSLTPQTVSRPPSREGQKSAWRSRNDVQLDAEAINHLKQYEETGNESFMSSAFNALDLAADVETSLIFGQQHAHTLEDADLPNARRHSNPEIDYQLPEEFQTHNSNASTESTVKTSATESSQRTRVLPTIAPDKVSHLIHGETAGMRYDSDRKTWVKCKTGGLRTGNVEHVSSSATTEEDPFNNIPDLSVHEKEANDNNVVDATGLESDDFGSKTDQGSLRNMHETVREVLDSEDDPSACAEIHNSESSELAADVELDTPADSPRDYADSLTLSLAPNPAVRIRRGEMSVFFSSPPVSHAWPARSWGTTSEHESQVPARTANDYESDEEETEELVEHVQNNSRQNRGIQGYNTTPLVSRTMSLSCLDEQHELSLIEERLDGRKMSLTLSISTPMQHAKRRGLSSAATSGLQRRGILRSMSPLSEFTLHQDDDRHFQSRKLAGTNQQLVIGDRNGPTAVSAKVMVERLTDVEPDGPYWDWMRTLDFRSKDVDNLHMLDEFCPRIERLDASSNKLTQLSGAPPAIRELLVQNNCLSSLTAWDHLVHLQYLDVSHNDLDTLQGVGGLVHLRSLRADDNRITSLEGIFDLDGLLDLSLKRNKLQRVDFATSALKRLTSLNLAGNQIDEVEGISNLIQLTELDLCDNKLREFPSADRTQCVSRSLKILNIQGNALEGLDVGGFPALEHVYADDNKLVRIEGVSKVDRIRTVSMRDQNPDTVRKPTPLFTNDLCEVYRLRLSNNSIPSMPDMCHFLNLQSLELASAGLTSLPAKFGALTPNLRVLNLNFNGLGDLRPLRDIVRLKELHVAGNRLNRLRRTIATVQKFTDLELLDLRSNPFTVGFYAATPAYIPELRSPDSAVPKEHEDGDKSALRHVLPPVDARQDERYCARLDHDTKLKRRVYELLLATRCHRLKRLDGIDFCKDRPLAKDDIWELLKGCGVVEQVSNRGLHVS